MAASAGRRRYRWLVLLVSAVLLAIWFLTPADQDGPTSGSGSSADTPSATSSSSPSPTHELTQTNTPTTDTTQFPPTDPAETGQSGEDPESGLPFVRVDDLPPQVAGTITLILAGGPYPEPDHDGGTFGNREGLLPDADYGYYREYTVPTPGSGDRGARRIVEGGDGELYYTADHYDSFARIAGYP